MNRPAEEVFETSAEDRFFGVTTTVTQGGETDGATEPEIEVVDDRPPEDQRPPRKPESEASPASTAKPDDDDDDEELTGYSEKVKKRIAKLRYDQHEERRKREAAERMREEAVRVAQQALAKNQQIEHQLHSGEAYLVEQVKRRAALSADAAKEKYRKAYEEGDTDAIIAAQEEFIQSQTELRETDEYDREYQGRAQRFAAQQEYQHQQHQQHQQVPPPAQQQVPQPSTKAKQWAEENPWFGNEKHKDMTSLAYGVHETLVRERGMAPDSDEYFEEIDKAMHMRFPDYFDQETGTGRETPSTDLKPTTVVAPASRNSGVRPRKVKLTSTQAALAKRLGLTLEQYAKQLMKEK